MKIRADEHVSPRIIAAVRSLKLPRQLTLSSIYHAGHQGREDVDWITLFAQEGGRAILSGDRDFIKRPPQMSAVAAHGLIIIAMPPPWCTQGLDVQASCLVRWWRKIEETVSAASPVG